MIRILFAVVAVFCAAFPVAAAEDVDANATDLAPKHLRILALGNSFTYCATLYLRDIVAASPYGDTIRIETVWLPGASLEWQWEAIQIFEAEKASGAEKHVCPPDSNCGAVGHGRPGGKGLCEWLTDETFDYITLQQYSRKSMDADSYRPYAQQLKDYVRKWSPNTKVVLHETWAYRADDRYYKEGNSAGKMYYGLRDAYATIAKELDCGVIPVGDAIWTAYEFSPEWNATFPDPNFDYENGLVPTALPVQTHSLQPGYKWVQDKAGNWKLGGDLRHLSTAGSYLAGCVWYEYFYGHSIIGNSFLPEGLTAEDAAVLQKIAHRVVTEGYSPPMPKEK